MLIKFLQTAEEKPELAKAKVTEEADDVEAAERAAGILNQVAEVIKDVLGLSEEEFNQFLEELYIPECDKKTFTCILEKNLKKKIQIKINVILHLDLVKLVNLAEM